MTDRTSEGERARLAGAYRHVFGSTAGQVVLQDLAAAAGMADAGFADHPQIDPLAMASRDGKRRIVLRILSFLELGELDIIHGALRRQHERAREQEKEARHGQT